MSDAPIRPHADQHDAIDDLPLITETAEVTEVERMDRDRRGEIIEAANQHLRESGLTERYGELDGPEDWGALADRLGADGHADLARRLNTLMQRYERPKPMLTRARFRAEDDVDFVAGQYIGLRYGGTSRAYSLANSPTEDELEICVRRVPGGRLSPTLCDDLSVGAEVTVRGPYGELVLNDHSPRDIVFLATGTGVAPLKGMIDYLFETGRDEYEGEKRDVWLFLGAAWQDDLPYREAFRRYQKRHDNFHFVPCLSRELSLSEWDGETDYVQHALLKHADDGRVTTALGDRLEEWLTREPDSGVDARVDPSNIEVYACGINAMVHSLVKAVERLGVPDRYIESEGFG
jgi:ferredoxin-NADP reductase